MVSQFMLADFDIDGIVVQPKANTLVPEVEFMTGVDTWLNVQVKMSSVDGLVCLHTSACRVLERKAKQPMPTRSELDKLLSYSRTHNVPAHSKPSQ